MYEIGRKKKRYQNGEEEEKIKQIEKEKINDNDT